MPKLDWATAPASDLRRAYADARAALAGDVPADVTVKDAFGGLCFTPPHADRPPILYFHGGGWIVGAPNTHRSLCGCLAKRAGAPVYAVPYRLAPDHPWPAQAEDARTRLMDVTAQLGPVIVAGDSAGAAMAFWADGQAQDGQTLAVVSLYGAFGYVDTPSLARFGPGSDGLTAADVAAMYDRLGVGDPSALRRLIRADGPPVLMLTAGQDPLADDTALLAQILTDRAVTHLRAEDQAHGFLQYAGRDLQAADHMGAVASWIRTTMPATSPPL